MTGFMMATLNVKVRNESRLYAWVANGIAFICGLAYVSSPSTTIVIFDNFIDNLNRFIAGDTSPTIYACQVKAYSRYFLYLFVGRVIVTYVFNLRVRQSMGGIGRHTIGRYGYKVLLYSFKLSVASLAVAVGFRYSAPFISRGDNVAALYYAIFVVVLFVGEVVAVAHFMRFRRDFVHLLVGRKAE